MDNALTQRIQDWLNGPQTDINEGATLLLKLNCNRILYGNILRRPDKLHDKLVYELNKYLMMRLDGMTTQAVANLDAEVRKLPSPDKLQQQETETGFRKDHDALPQSIKMLFIEAHNLLVDMRPLHERLKLMEKDKPCDRYPFLKELVAKHKKRRELLNAYDAYDNSSTPAQTEEETAPDKLKLVSSARSYLSTNLPRLQRLIEEGRNEEADALRNKIRQRLATLNAADAEISDKVVDRLNAVGITIATTV